MTSFAVEKRLAGMTAEKVAPRARINTFANPKPTIAFTDVIPADAGIHFQPASTDLPDRIADVAIDMRAGIVVALLEFDREMAAGVQRGNRPRT